MESESGHAPDSRLEKCTGSAFLNIVLVGVIGEDGKLTTVQASEIEHVEFDILGINWEGIAAFFKVCQLYG